MRAAAIVQSLRSLQLLAPLRHAHFRLLFAGQVVSNIGDWLNILALVSLIIYRWELGASSWGAVLIAITLPYAVAGPFAGVLTDRWPRRRVMILCDLARAAVVLGLVWADSLATVLILVGTGALFSTVFAPAKQGAIRMTVPEVDLLAASSLSELSDNAARLIGPSLGGLLLVLAGPHFAFVVDALTFLASAALLSRLPALAPESVESDRPLGIWSDLRGGLQHIAASRLLRVAVGVGIITSLLIRSTDTLAALVLKELGVGIGLQGVSSSILGAGYVGGAIAVGQWGQRYSPLGALGLTRVEIGVVLASLGLGVSLGWHGTLVIIFAAFVSRALVGFGFAAAAAVYGFILQAETPPPLMGRVSASANAAMTAIPLAGPPIATLLAAWLGLGPAYVVLASGLLLSGVVLLALRHTADRPQPSDLSNHRAGGADRVPATGTDS